RPPRAGGRRRRWPRRARKMRSAAVRWKAAMSVRDGPFHPLRVAATPCEAATVREHLSAFIRRFIRPDRRDRAEHVVFRLAPNDADRLKDLQHMLDERYTAPPRDPRLPAGLPDVGVYYAGGDQGW